MEESSVHARPLLGITKQLLRRLLTMGENRLELLAVEVQQERERLLHALLMALGIAAFGLLAGLTLTAAIAVLLWSYSPVVVLLALTTLYGATAVYLCRRLAGRLRDWQSFSASLEQLRKDRACLERSLE